MVTFRYLNFGNMTRHNQPSKEIVSYDGDFGDIPSLTVWEPMDVIP